MTAAPPRVTRPADLVAIAGCADVIELRLDLLGIIDVDGLVPWIEASPRPVLATLRSAGEGGAYTGTPQEAHALLTAAARLGAAAIDVESGVVQAFAGGVDAMVVGSTHGWSLSGSSFRSCTLRKRAVPVRTEAELVDARRLSARDGFVVPYGALGAARALFVASTGRSGLLFGAPDEASAVIAGQPPLTVLLDELRAGEVSVVAALFGLVGDPPARSPSPAMHNSVFRAGERDALHVPLPGLSLDEALALGLHGLSVTTPHKGAAHERAATLDVWATRSGVVNTLLRNDDRTWHGLDTDARAIAALAGPPPAGCRGALVYGAGGYARTAAITLRSIGYEVRIAARSARRGASLADELGVPFLGAALDGTAQDSLVLNATPAGALDDDTHFLGATSLSGMRVLDAPYRAQGVDTALVARARTEGAAVIDGRALLLEQAVHQALAFGSDLDEEALRRVLRLALFPPPSLWLVGLRGSGKSTVGRLLARGLGRPFVDLDDEVQRVHGHTVAAHVERFGWPAFRRLEAELFERVRHRRGVVVATGGGLIETAAPRAALKEEPCVAYLHLDPAAAAARVRSAEVARPRLPGLPPEADEAEAMYRRRDAAYRSVASLVMDANGTPEDIARGLGRGWLGTASDLLANKA